MRTTLDIPDDVMRSVKVHAAQADRTITEAITELLRQGLAHGEGPSTSTRVTLPLVRTSRQASAEDLSPERIADLLGEQRPQSSDA